MKETEELWIKSRHCGGNFSNNVEIHEKHHDLRGRNRTSTSN